MLIHAEGGRLQRCGSQGRTEWPVGVSRRNSIVAQPADSMVVAAALT